MRVFSFDTLGGDYRRVVVRPRGFEWDLVRYGCATYDQASPDHQVTSTPITRSPAP